MVKEEDTIIRKGSSSGTTTNLLQMFESKEGRWNSSWKVVCGKNFWFFVCNLFVCLWEGFVWF